MSIWIGTAFHRRFCSWSRAAGRVKNHLGLSLAAPCKRTYANDAPRIVTPLEKIIFDSIKSTGPISVAEYTQLCLSHPTEGYYMKERGDGTDLFGTQGDFITSPEISQVFGELVGIWLLAQWLELSDGASRKPKIRLVELGPGRGTLMDDILRTFFNWPKAKAALSSVNLVETSPAMRAKQKEKLAHWYKDTPTFQTHTYTSVDAVPAASHDEYTMVIAHEFFDALPAHILEKASDGFREVLVDLHHLNTPSGVSSTASKPPFSPFRFVVSPTTTPRSNVLGALSPRFAKLPLGARLEVSKDAWLTARTMGDLISGRIADGRNDELDASLDGQLKDSNGCGLIIDYGDDRVFGSSFRAFKKHRLVDVFETPGMSDLTTNVDFALLKESFTGIATAHGPLPQSEFLLRMGIRERLDALMKQAPDETRRHEIDHAGRRLIERSGQGMGAVYRVLGITGLPDRSGPNATVWPFIDVPSSGSKGGV